VTIVPSYTQFYHCWLKRYGREVTEIKDKVADKISEMTGNKSPQDQAKDKASEAFVLCVATKLSP